MCNLKPTETFTARVSRWRKNHPKELQAVLSNLDTYMRALADGLKPQQLTFGFLHRERNGVWVIDQKGGGKNLAQTRLYLYPDIDAGVVWLLTLGGKEKQKADINAAHEYVDSIRKMGSAQNDQEDKQD